MYILSRRQSLPLSGLTNAQLADHYADCIKLSTENVSTSKLYKYVLWNLSYSMPSYNLQNTAHITVECDKLTKAPTYLI